MDVAMINNLVAGLGCTYSKLLVSSAISNVPLEPSIKGGDNEYLIQRPEAGVELWFWAETATLEKVLFSLIRMVDGASVYTGELPSPFTHNMHRLGVKAMLGEPFESKEPIKILRSRRYGVGEAYRLASAHLVNTKVGFQYRNDDKVCSMGFSLINSGR